MCYMCQTGKICKEDSVCKYSFRCSRLQYIISVVVYKFQYTLIARLRKMKYSTVISVASGKISLFQHVVNGIFGIHGYLI